MKSSFSIGPFAATAVSVRLDETNHPPLGAHIDDAGVVYRVWAPGRENVRVALGGNGRLIKMITLNPEGPEGYFAARDPEGQAGDLYRVFLDDGALVPDVASRYQPFGVFGPSAVIDPRCFSWEATSWTRPPLKGRVIYELHVGTFTPAGTFRAALERLDALVDLGVNCIEIMPVAEFPGRWNWGYDGVMPFAPARCYGTPDDFRALVDAAHKRGLAVVLDVVYNHFGPEGNYLSLYSEWYLHPTKKTHWGRAFNLDADPVRNFFTQNALYWLDEFRIDGLRFDSTHSVDDQSPQHLFAEIATAVHSRGAFAIAEDERNETSVVTPRALGGWGFDGVWADDFHHTVRVALTGQKESHFGSFTGSADEWAETLMHGWYFRGQYYSHWKRGKGGPAQHLPPESFVFCISNHDQVGNRAAGDRLHTGVSMAGYRAVSMLLCLSPYTPMLFMGQEWAASTPFLFFTDMPGDLGENMAAARISEFRKYGINGDRELLENMPDPQKESTFTSSKLDWDECARPPHAGVRALYRACLKLRGSEEIFQNPPRETWSVGKLDEDRVGVRWIHNAGDWLLVFGLGGGQVDDLSSSEFTRPHPGLEWRLMLDSNDSRFCDLAGPLPADSGAEFVLPGAGCRLFRECTVDASGPPPIRHRG